ATLFALLAKSPTPVVDAAVLMVGTLTVGLGVCLLGFAYSDLFGPSIKRDSDSGSRRDAELPSKLRVKDRRHRQAARVEEAPFIELEDQPDET
ncbi:MAG: hypothetical protein AAFU85_23115, partial [Planctomycetota bacterium]